MKKCKEEGCFNDGCCRDKRCPHHTKGSRDLRSYSAGRKYPTDPAPHLGVELECIAPDSLIFKALRAQGRIPCSDGSLSGLGCEFKLCLAAKTAISKVPRFAGRLASLGATVNSSCGLHVHLDARGVTQERKSLFLKWLEKIQDWLFSLMPPSRRCSTYCRRLPETGHYAWANKTDFNTIEIRIHGGSLNPHKIAGWLNVCNDLMTWLRNGVTLPEIEYDKEGTMTLTNETLLEIFPTPASREYLLARQEAKGILSASTLTPNGPTNELEN